MLKINHVFFSHTSHDSFVLKNLCLSVNKGDYISIVGENGSGKSTLLRLLLGFIQPSKGTIDLKAKNIRYVAQKINFSQLGFPITVHEVLTSYQKLLKIKDSSTVDRVLKQTDMIQFKHSLMDTLSGGQAQRIALARALIGEPDLLVLDEPSTGVDLKNQETIYAILRNLNRTKQLTILSVEHNLTAAIQNSTKIFHLVNGNGHLCSPEQYTQEVLQNHLKENTYVTI
jgi:zinc transport system ATP-binding protein